MAEKSLNSKQKEAIEHKDGPLLIVAGAGTGKTRVLAERVARLISTGVNPSHILAITFTNKAAGEMRERIHAILHKSKMHSTPFFIRETPFIGTFHSLGVHILREHGEYIEIKKNFSIKDRDDSVRITKEAIQTLGLDPKIYIPSKIHAIIGKQKGSVISVEECKENAGGNHFFTIVADVREHYDALLKKENALDFDDLIYKAVFLLKTNREVLEYYQNKWRFLHIDEYQDTNEGQYMFSHLLAAKHKNICVVGDSDQNIYSWRGANIQNILRFEEDYPNARVVVLEENYRSTKIILDAANEVIKKNKIRKEKNLFTQKGGGEKISLYAAADETEEAYFVAEEARTLLSKEIAPENIAVLYRANFQSRILEEAFLSLSIPYQIIGTRFFERKEVKDVISFIAAALNKESLGNIRRIINVPPRGIGKATIAKIFSGQEKELSIGVKKRVQEFFSLLEKIKRACDTLSPYEVIRFILKESALEQYLKNEGDDGMERLENIKELGTFASRYTALPREEQLQAFLTDAALASDQDALLNNKKGVRLMTVHAAKGLEFQHVFITGLEQGLFPHERGYEGELSGESAAEEQEEERRLFYVALTRAKEKVHLSFAARRTLFGASYESVPSEFFNDIRPELIEPIQTSRAEKTIFFD